MSSGQEWTPRVQRAPGGARERLQYVASLMREDRFDEARDELLALLHQDERFIQARMMLGGLYLRQQLHADALDQFKYAIELDPMQAQAHIRAGTCCLRLQDFEQAEALLQTALDLDPKQAAAHVGMAQVLAQTDRAAEAITHVDEALRLDPQMAQARMLLAQLLDKSGNAEGAIEELSDFVNANPDHTAASVRLAMMQAKKGNIETTIEILAATLKSNPQSTDLWDLLGRMKMLAGDYEGAADAFTAAVNLKTPDRATPLRLVDSLLKQSKFDEARDILQSMPRGGRMASVVHGYYGDIFAGKQLYDEAVESYRAALLHTGDGDILREVDIAAAPGADSEAKIPHFQAAIQRVRAETRERRKTDRAAEGSRGKGGGANRRRGL